MFVIAMTFFNCNVLNVNSVKCVSTNIQECKIRLKIMNINSNEPLFYFCSVEINKSVVVAIILIIHMQNYVFLMLFET